MAENWKTYKLSEIASVQTGPFGSLLHKKDYVKVGTPIITVEHLGQNRITHQNLPRVTSKDKARLSKYHLKEGDVVFSRVGSVDRRAYVTVQEDGWLFSGRCLRIRANKLLANGSFLSYYFGQESFKDYIRRIAVGATMPSINTSILSSIEINLPSLPEQRAIASILSALDDKIELNLQMNKTLEEMAMTLYKYWFVDFGPFKDGEFVDSELGLIPEGWEVKGILDLTNLLSGGTPRTKVSEYWNGNINWVSAKDIGNGGVIYINDTEKTITDDGVNNSSTKILPEDTVILVARGSVGKYGMIAKPMAMNQSCYGLFTKSKFSQGLVYLMFSRLIEQFQRMAYGSVFDTITTSTFNSTTVVSPPSEIVNNLKEFVDPLFLKLKRNTIENQTLTSLRDTLLPKLISGAVRVKEARQTLTEVL